VDDDHIRDVFSGLGPVSIRKMFGGKGVYHQGLIVGVLLSTGELLLKADATSAPDFAAAGATQWAYEARSGKAAHMPYWSIPDSAMDDPDELSSWTRKAYEAALRSAGSR
jgi:DNA transformation protein